MGKYVGAYTEGNIIIKNTRYDYMAIDKTDQITYILGHERLHTLYHRMFRKSFGFGSDNFMFFTNRHSNAFENYARYFSF